MHETDRWMGSQLLEQGLGGLRGHRLRLPPCAAPHHAGHCVRTHGSPSLELFQGELFYHAKQRYESILAKSWPNTRAHRRGCSCLLTQTRLHSSLLVDSYAGHDAGTAEPLFVHRKQFSAPCPPNIHSACVLLSLTVSGFTVQPLTDPACSTSVHNS